MGYTTFVVINMIEHDCTTEKHASEEFQKLMKESQVLNYQIEDDSAEFEDNNGNTLQAIVDNSKNYPGILLQGTVDGTSEDSFDLRTFRIRGGELEEHRAVITYPPFQTIRKKKQK